MEVQEHAGKVTEPPPPRGVAWHAACLPAPVPTGGGVMARRSLAVWLVVLAALVSCSTHAAEPALESGDLVFETSSSSQSSAIQWATAEPLVARRDRGGLG